MSLGVCIFSYNRAAFLENCVRSIQNNLPGCRWKVYDDNSDDPATRDYLDTLGEQVSFSKESTRGPHGGLYKNMQLALDEAETDYTLFLQDDSQVVRFVDAEDVKIIADFFATYPQSAFIYPCFLQGQRRDKFKKYKITLIPEVAGYFIDTHLRAYNDIAIVNVARLKAIRWQFFNSEGQNGAEARKHFSMMMWMAHPFIMHVPEPPVFRYKINTLASRIAASSIKSQFFKTMKTEEVRTMRSRPLSEIPFAEDFLHTQNPRVGKPYIYSNVRARFYIRALNKVEFLFKRIFRKRR